MKNDFEELSALASSSAVELGELMNASPDAHRAINLSATNTMAANLLDEVEREKIIDRADRGEMTIYEIRLRLQALENNVVVRQADALRRALLGFADERKSQKYNENIIRV
jgi:hypothetical protein